MPKACAGTGADMDGGVTVRSPAEGILGRLRCRDRAALRELAVTFGTALTRAAYLQIGDAHAAEDATQETLLAAWKGASRTSRQTPLRPWLYRILFNVCRNHLRSLRRRRRRERIAIRLRMEGSASPEESARLVAVQEALMRLDEGQRSVIILRYERGLSVAETAQALEIPEGTVKSRAHGAIRRLREAMDR